MSFPKIPFEKDFSWEIYLKKLYTRTRGLFSSENQLFIHSPILYSFTNCLFTDTFTHYCSFTNWLSVNFIQKYILINILYILLKNLRSAIGILFRKVVVNSNLGNFHYTHNSCMRVLGKYTFPITWYKREESKSEI